MEKDPRMSAEGAVEPVDMESEPVEGGEKPTELELQSWR